MKKGTRILVIIGLIGACAWLLLYSFNLLAWRLYSPPPETEGIALADLDGDGDLDTFLANGRNEGSVPNTVLFNDGNGHYTWWTYRFRARERNVGWRIDYFMVTPDLRDRVREAGILPDVMGSDHCPVSLVLT